MPKVLLVEDDAIMGESICDRFMLEEIEHEWAQSAEAALTRLRHVRFDCLVSDIRLPDHDGETLFSRALENGILSCPTIFITGFGTQQQAERLLSLGAADYLTKPVDLEQLVEKIRLLVAGQKHARAMPGKPVLGVSREMRRLEEMAARLGDQWRSVLITGESGVGKEEVSRLLHRSSGGPNRPFVAVNCGAIPESMMEAELFGYERGAFTGAERTHRGYFEQANGGTIFLDEIGELSAGAQVRLLRILQEHSLRRLGSETSTGLQFRLIAATNRDIRGEVRAGRFREDLYYRINVVHLRVPPLRDRPEDVEWLARLFLDQWNHAHPGSPRMLSEPTLACLRAAPWRGNVRQLKHAVERACLLAAHPLLRPDDFTGHGDDEPEPASSAPPQLSGPSDRRAPIVPLADFAREQERQYLTQVLAQYNGQITQAATALGISRKTLWEKTRKLGIRAADSQPE